MGTFAKTAIIDYYCLPTTEKHFSVVCSPNSGNMETGRHGDGDIDMETWKHGEMQTWRHGETETWRHGETET
jgi:hypothetical protein